MSAKPFSQACENNKQPILAEIRNYFLPGQKVLEVGSGTGQHAVHFAANLPGVFWQTSDLPENHAGINAWIRDSGLTNIGEPIPLDVTHTTWPVGFDGVFSANTAHIMPWQAVQQFIPGAAAGLNAGGVFCLYGPFNYGGQYTSASNADFDRWLKSRYPHQGIRDFEAVNGLAVRYGLRLLDDIAMPANNRLLVWRKEEAVND